MFEDPLEELTFRNVGNQGRVFNGVEDRYLLCLTHLHGYGNWDSVRASIRKCERFRFDYYLLSCSADALGKRCEALMRAAERELVEMERKRSAADSMKNSSQSAPQAKKSIGDQSTNEQKIVEMTKQIADEVRRLNQTRDKLKVMQSDSVVVPKPAAEEAAPVEVKRGVGAPIRVVPVPDGLAPELCKMLVKAGYDGITKVINSFVAKYPHMSKRQTELRIIELAVKEKHEEDRGKVWHIRPEFAHFLNMDNFDETPEAVPHPIENASSSAPVTEKKRKSSGGEPSSKTSKAPISKTKEKDTSAAATIATKRKRDDIEEPKKYKNAFNIFVKRVRAEAEQSLLAEKGSTPTVCSYI